MNLTDRQLYGLYAIPRHADGTPKLHNPFEDDPIPEEVFKRMLWMNGITDKAQQSEMWATEKKRRARLAADAAVREASQAAHGGVGVVPPFFDG